MPCTTGGRAGAFDSSDTQWAVKMGRPAADLPWGGHGRGWGIGNPNCEPESLVSGLVFSLSERGSSIGRRLASDGTEAGEKGQIGNSVSPSEKET